jgi:predicted RNase H-like HicB family nuclease
MKLSKNINAIITSGEEGGYVAECREISVVTQGQTLDDVTKNLKEAVELFLEGEDPKEFGLDGEIFLLVERPDSSIKIFKNAEGMILL